jgi:hypothetical protein
MANGWTRVKRVLSRPFKRRGRDEEAAPDADRRREKLFGQVAVLCGQIDDLKREILRGHGLGRKTVSAGIHRRLIRARDLRYKLGLLRAELRRGPGSGVVEESNKSPPAESPAKPRSLADFECLLDSPDHRERILALRGLHNLPSPVSVPACLSCMADRSPEVRRSAATILGWERYHPAAPALAILLKDEDREVRRAAVEALGALGEEQSVYSLIRALEDEDDQVRIAAREALFRTVPIPIELDVDEDPEVLFPKIEGLIRWWVDARVEGSLRECENE